MIKESLYYGKILLFGEYGIIQDSMGLSIPFNDYNGKFLYSEKPSKENTKSNNQLNLFLQHLLNLQSDNSLPCHLNLERFKDPKLQAPPSSNGTSPHGLVHMIGLST